MALAGLVGGAPPAAATPPSQPEFDSARAKDDLAGAFSDDEVQLRVQFFATTGSTLSLTFGPDARSSDPASSGYTLSLLDPDSQDAGTLVDGKEKVLTDGSLQWKGVKLAKTGVWTLLGRSAGPGTWRMRFTSAWVKATASAATSVFPGSQDQLPFDGFARGQASYKLSPQGSNSRFRGEAVRIVQPDGSDLPNFEAGASSGKVTLLQDGRHVLVYANQGNGSGGGKASVTANPPKATTRTGYVDPTGAAFLPVVKKLDPPKTYHKDAAFALTVTGRDFQPGADVRLVRNGRQDIVATDVDVLSETELRCVLDLDTLETEGQNSTGKWTLAIWNEPGRGDTRTRNAASSFECLSSGSITLPPGIFQDVEVWYVDFNGEFQGDLDRMGLGSNDETVSASARGVVEAYTILFLRDLYRLNETTGAPNKGKSVPVSFIVKEPTAAAGVAGRDYNRIEVGGAKQDGDLSDPTEPLAWGYAPVDPGNAHRDDLSIDDADGNRVGLGARTRVLDPESSSAAVSWQEAMQPLRTRPLVASDWKYFQTNFFPSSQAEADRYKDIVGQVSRASREIAAILAHHIGKSMGLPSGADSGPMANPDSAGNMWLLPTSLHFNDSDAATLRNAAVPHQLPGKSSQLHVKYMPMVTTHTYLLEECTTEVTYSTRFGFVGGRPNAARSDYRAQYVQGSVVPLGLRLSYDGLDGKAPLWVNQATNQYYCTVSVFRVAITDLVRGGVKFFQYRLNIVPNVPLLPAQLQPAAQACVDTVRSSR